MSDQKKPEGIADEDLDGAQGGLLQFEIQMNKTAPSVRKDSGEAHFGTWGTSSTTGLKQPGKNMEVVNEDE